MRTGSKWAALFLAAGMVTVILDSKLSAGTVVEGLSLCMYTVIPSLFPLMLLSCMLISRTTGLSMRLLTPLGKVCGIPGGAEPILLTGLIGGYPIGAKAVADAWRAGSITKKDARRMLGFCSNAGPAFIFGIFGPIFARQDSLWALWGIHLLSAILVGSILPGKSKQKAAPSSASPLSLPAALKLCTATLAVICGWVILFRILIGFCEKWFLWLVPQPLNAVICGLLEMTNGCTLLAKAGNNAVRFCAASAILAFGGTCVLMQTASVCGDLGLGMYLPGKLLQTVISISLSSIILGRGPVESACFIAVSALIIFLISKITVAFFENLVYNREKQMQGGPYAFSKKNRKGLRPLRTRRQN